MRSEIYRSFILRLISYLMGFRLIGLYDTIKHVAVFLHAV
ncbi:hypothetical protein HMPREF1418_00889 [Helicobacter pylori GAM260BSi]|uniref:Uncharacterized protein n=1 Tax=Helicobacter pylori GAM260BSi TaxID=1159046 RepID=M3N4W1_HELPX|nr:hypothetical protein HMPREF1418_00889 [Helicobacter pylori GAM260BSi]